MSILLQDFIIHCKDKRFISHRLSSNPCYNKLMNYQIIDYSPLEKDYRPATRRAGQQISLGISLMIIDLIVGWGWLLALGIALTGWGVFFLTTGVREHKLKAFAKINDGSYHSKQLVDNRPISLFLNSSSEAYIHRLVNLPGGLELGNLLITTNQHQSVTYSFVKFSLRKPVPHFLIKKRWSITESLHSLTGPHYDHVQPQADWEAVSTTHQFAELFQVYTHPHNLRTVHGILAPDVMSRIIDHSKTYDIEAIENDCYIIMEGMVDFSNADKMRAAMTTLEGIEPDLNQEIIKIIK